MIKAEKPNTLIPSRRAFLGAVLAASAVGVPAGAIALSEAPTPLAAPPGPNPDATLLRMVDDCIAAETEQRRWGRIRDREYRKHKAMHPMPDVLNIQPEDVDLGIPDAQRKLEYARKHGVPCDNYNDAVTVDMLRKATWNRPPPPEVLLEEIRARLIGDKAGAGGEYSFALGAAMGEYKEWREEPSPAARARADEIIAAYDEWHPRIFREPRAQLVAQHKSYKATIRVLHLQRKIARIPARTMAGLAAKAKAFALTIADEADDAKHMHMVARSFMRDVLALADRKG